MNVCPYPRSCRPEQIRTLLSPAERCAALSIGKFTAIIMSGTTPGPFHHSRPMTRLAFVAVSGRLTACFTCMAFPRYLSWQKSRVYTMESVFKLPTGRSKEVETIPQCDQLASSALGYDMSYRNSSKHKPECLEECRIRRLVFSSVTLMKAFRDTDEPRQG